MIARGNPPTVTMPVLAQQHEAVVSGQRTTIMRIDNEGRRLHFLAAPSLPTTWTDAFDGLPIGPSAGACPTAAWRRETVICADIATDPLWDRLRGVALAHGVRAIWSVPILGETGELLGVIGCCADTPRAPTAAELELTVLAAEVAAAAIERQRSDLAVEARLTLSVHAANIGLWDWDLSTNRVYFSPEWKSQLGYLEYELPDEFETWRSRVHPDDLDVALQRVQAYIADPKPGFESELRLRHRDGSWRWILANASMLYDVEGKPQRMLGCHIDVTERRRQEDLVRDHARRLQQASRKLLEVEATERRGLARELHDRVGQNLSSLLMNLSLLRGLLPAPQAIELDRRLDDTEALLELTVTEVRGVLQDLRPAELDDFGLWRALRFHAQTLGNRAGFSVEEGPPPAALSLPVGAETAMYRIGLEALTNIAKHAGASHVGLFLESAPDHVTLRIEDDGKGLSDEVESDGGGRGVRGMQERAEALGADFVLQARAEGGTRVSLRVPREIAAEGLPC